MSTSKLMWVLGFLAITLVAVPWIIVVTGRSDLYYTLTAVALLAIASGGVWLTFYIGRINIGQAAYALLGGYISAILVVRYGVPFWHTLPLAGVLCAGASVLIGLPILRLRGVYFAMVTLVLTEVARLLALALPVTNGAKGLVNIPLPGPITLFSVELLPDFAALANPRRAFYFAAVVLMVMCYTGLYRLVHSRIGRLCLSLQQNEELASSIGVNVAYLRLVIYAVSSFLGGIAGAMFIAISQSIYPSSFTTADSINFMLNCFLGGLGYVLGPILGTFLLYFGWDLLFKTGQFQLLIFSSVLIVLMLTLPNGLLSLGPWKQMKGTSGG
ncbi:branched-chain amino acid ABC transporter permease [Microvirga calopogonii]|uniref:branched-chain amino acid ABC transporter permease n=1 Tax=Microvirga calopogonii TaxID=2078013 RepID=UPI000E0D6BA5|nr:branched-chain amino acid ABC transporter permease [Microvirga calopogonii]